MKTFICFLILVIIVKVQSIPHPITGKLEILKIRKVGTQSAIKQHGCLSRIYT